MKPTYESPLASRYASKTMLHLFSPDIRYETWRRLWVALARAEHTLGLPITQAQVDELAAHVSPIDYDVVAAREKRCGTMSWRISTPTASTRPARRASFT